jgi:hypothetical protein
MANAVAVTSESEMERFIDKIKAFFVAAEPAAEAVETAAVAAEPILALTPAGPEYQVAVNAIVGAQQVAEASLAAGTNLTGTQKAAIAVQAATPALNTILSSKGVSSNTEAVISTWIQNVFNILAGPIGTLVKHSGTTTGASAS